MATVTLRPNADGSLLECAIFPVAPSTHYDKVDEVTPNDDTDYVYSRSTPEVVKDCFLKPSSGIPMGSTINSVTIYNRGIIYADELGMILGVLKTLLKIAAVIQLGSAQQPDSWTTFSTTYATSPFTGSPWTVLEVEAVEIGTECASRWSPGAEIASMALCSTVWVVIDYTPPVVVAKRVVGDGLTCVVA